MKNHHYFFQEQVPALLAELRPESHAQWGTMNAAQMLDHITAGTKLFMAQREMEIDTPVDKIPRYQAWLMTEANFNEGAQKPTNYADYESAKYADFEHMKKEFLAVLADFDALTSTQSDFWTVHPSFGKLDAEHTRQLQYKHLRHHLQQFGLMPR
jgi:hypothetical protein